MDSDADLVSRLRRGDPASFRVAYARHESRVFRFLLRLSNDRAVAEDLFQETWLAFARGASRLEDTSNLAPLLLTIARNKFRNWRRWAMLDWSRVDLLRWGPRVAAAHDGDAREALAQVEHALQELPLPAREILLLVAIEGLEPNEAAAVLGIAPDAARQRLARARAQLSTLLERHGLREAKIPRTVDGGER